MNPSGELFKLIKSLTKSEKRFFKLSSSLQSGEKNYLRLFNAIEKQKEYDEEAIKKSFKNERFVKHLPSEKNHLYKLILKSLRSYYTDSNVSSVLKEEIKNIEILYGKALYKECSKLIRKSKKTAYEHEKFYYLLELIKWEKLLLEEEYMSGNFDQNLNQLIKEEQEVIEKLRNVAEYQILYSKINYVFRKGGYVRNDKEKQIVNEISDYHLIKGANTALSKRAAATCYYIKGLCAVVNYEYRKSYQSFCRVSSIFENSPMLIQDIPKQYIKSLENLLLCFIDHKDFKSFFDLFDKIQSIKDSPEFSSIDIQLKIFTSSYRAELIAYERMGQFNRALERVDEILDGLEKYKNKIPKEDLLLFYYHLSYIFFGAGKIKEALKWLNLVLNDNEANLRQDVYSFARLFNLIIHFELGNYDLLDYIIKSTNRFYLKRKRELNREYKFETVFLGYFKSIAKLYADEEKLQPLFKQLQSEIQLVLKDNYEKVAMEYFDFVTWIDSKIRKESFGKIKNEQLSEK